MRERLEKPAVKMAKLEEGLKRPRKPVSRNYT